MRFGRWGRSRCWFWPRSGRDREIFDPGNATFTVTLANYGRLVAGWGQFFQGLGNSAVVTAGATVLAAGASAFAGYAYSRRRTRAMGVSLPGLIVLRLIPPIVLTLPLFPIVNALHLSDTHAVLIVLYAAFFVSLGSVIMRTFVDQVPIELDEAARMDGASLWQVIFRVVLPVAAPGVVAVAIFVAVFAWNEYLFAFIFTGQSGEDGAAGAGGDGGVDRRGGVGRAVCGDHAATAAGAAVRRAAAAAAGRRFGGGINQGVGTCPIF